MMHQPDGWELRLVRQVASQVECDSFWRSRFEAILSAASLNTSVHLAILVEPFLRYILEGFKTVESRFAVSRRAPYKQVASGDIVILKRAGGPITGLCEVSEAWFYDLDPSTWTDIRQEYSEALCAEDPSFWELRKGASYATLMRIRHVSRINSVPCAKRDRRGWVVLRSKEGSRQLSLIKE